MQKVKVLGKFQKNSRNSIFPEDPRSQKTKRRGCTGAPHKPRARLGPCRAQGWCGHPVWPPTLLFGLLKASDLKTSVESTLFQKTSRAPPPSKTLFRGSETPFWHPAGTGNWRRSSPSSSPTPLHQPSMIPPSMCE